MRNEEGAFVRFLSYWLFRYNGSYFWKELRVLQDGRFYFENVFCTFESLEEALQQGRIRTFIEEGERLSIGLTGFWVKEPMRIVEKLEFLKEVRDIQCELNGRPTTSDLCRHAFSEFQREPTEENRNRLKAAYEAIPRHLDCWLLGFDEKDIPIRKAIWGDDFASH